MQKEKNDSNIKRKEEAKKGATRAWACVPFCFGFRSFLGLIAAPRAFISLLMAYTLNLNPLISIFG